MYPKSALLPIQEQGADIPGTRKLQKNFNSNYENDFDLESKDFNAKRNASRSLKMQRTEIMSSEPSKPRGRNLISKQNTTLVQMDNHITPGSFEKSVQSKQFRVAEQTSFTESQLNQGQE
jgi:hypothetical protein